MTSPIEVAWGRVCDPTFPREFLLARYERGRLTIRFRSGFQSRAEHSVRLVLEALSGLPEPVAPCRLPLYIGDSPLAAPRLAGLQTLAYACHPAAPADAVEAMPDFIFSAWPEAGISDYNTTVAEIMAAGARPPEIPRVFWIGNPATNALRREAIALFAGHAGFEVTGMLWTGGPDQVAGGRHSANHFVSLPDHAQRQVLIDLPAAGYSGRMKLLLWSRRPVIILKSPFKEFFHHRLVSGENCVIVHSLEELRDAGETLLRDPARAAAIGAAGQELARRWLTRARAVEALRATLARLIAAQAPRA